MTRYLTALIALLGWYLMAPPLKGNIPDEKAPLSQWRVHRVYDLAEDCNKTMIEWRQRARAIERAIEDPKSKEYESKEYANETIGNYYVYARAICIATNDPRLAR